MTPGENSVPKVLSVFVVRHGQTQLNADGRLRGHLDIALDSVGQLEAARLANVLGRLPLRRIVTSPLRRARETAAPIAIARAIPIEPDDDLIDRDYGPWTGCPRSDVEARFGSLDNAPGVETIDGLEQRLLEAFNRVVVERHADNGPVLLVGHDATNAALLRALVPELAACDNIEQHTGCWNRLDLVGDRWHASVLNEYPTDASTGIAL